jgi:hypothetical protein
MTLARVAIPSPCYYQGRPDACRLIVVHTAEGARTFEDLGAFFANPANEVSSHAGIDDTPGAVGVYVRRGDRSWTQADYNGTAVSVELCAFAAWDAAEWGRHPSMLANLSAWIAEEAAAFNLPLVALTPAEAQGGAAGVCQHKDLGAGGGNHSDCGPAFPMAAVLEAAGGTPVPPTAPPGTTPPGTSPAPPWPGRYLAYPPVMQGTDVHTWQAQMADVRGWPLAVDGQYGPDSARVCSDFQAEKGLAVDGVVGPDTWAATWEAPIT